MHASVGNKSRRKTVICFLLEISLESPTVVTVNAQCAFVGASNNISIPTTEVLLRTAIGKLSKLKKLRNWMALNTVLLLPFLTEEVFLEGEKAVGGVLNTFTTKIAKRKSESATKYSEDKSAINLDVEDANIKTDTKYNKMIDKMRQRATRQTK